MVRATVFLVAGDGAGAHDDRVAGHDLHEPVVAVGHPGEARHRLALGAVVAMQISLSGTSLRRSLGTCWPAPQLEVAQVGRDARVLLHGAADDGHLATELTGGVEHLLDARDVAREGGHDDATRRGLP